MSQASPSQNEDIACRVAEQRLVVEGRNNPALKHLARRRASGTNIDFCSDLVNGQRLGCWCSQLLGGQLCQLRADQLGPDHRQQRPGSGSHRSPLVWCDNTISVTAWPQDIYTPGMTSKHRNCQSLVFHSRAILCRANRAACPFRMLPHLYAVLGARKAAGP